MITADNYLDIDFSKVETGEALADLLTSAFGGVDNTTILIDVIPELLENNISLQDPKQTWIRKLFENVNNIEAHLLKGANPGGPDAFREIYEILEVYGEDDNFGIEEIFETFIDGIEIYNFVYADNMLFCTLNKTRAEMNTLISNYFGFDSIDESCKSVSEASQRDWKARTKSFLDNDLFVDFDEPLTENAANNAYEAMMKVQDYIIGTLGWDIVDCQQDDEYSMMLKCDINGNDAIDELDSYCHGLAIDVSVVDNNSSAYDVRVYLSY